MMGKSILLAGAALFAVLAVYPAVAQEQAKPADNRPLADRVKALEDQLRQKAEEDMANRTRLSTLEQQFADTVWSFDNSRPTVQSADGRFLMALRYRVQFDTALFSQSSNINSSTAQIKDLASGSVVRRFYIGAEGRAFRDFWYEFRLDFGGSNAEATAAIVNLARISYNIGNIANPAIPHFRINGGIIQPIFTYGDSVSSGSTTFLERADAVNVAAAYGAQEPRRGVELTFQQQDLLTTGDNLLVSGAFVGQQPGANPAAPSNTTDEGTSLIGRLAYRIWSDGFSNVQVGGSGAYITNVTGNAIPGGPRTITLQDRPEVRVDGNRLVSTGGIPATGGSMWGLEAAANIQNFYFAGEYMRYLVDRDVNCIGCTVSGLAAGVNPGNPRFSGWYVEGSYILTGETKTYQANAANNEMGTFNNPRIITPFDPDSGNWGGWELAARYSDLDLNWHEGALGTTCTGAIVGCVRGGEQKIWTVGLNWYFNNNILLRFNYLNVDVDRLSATGAQIGQKFNVYALRLQFTN
jgi:phosphate-selective porin OprO/OprP